MKKTIWTMFIICVAGLATGCSNGVHASSNMPTGNETNGTGLAMNAINVVSGVTSDNGGTSAGQNSTVTQPSQSNTGKAPDWLIKDLEMAANVKFPVTATVYTLDWNAPDYANGKKSFNAYTMTHTLWIGGYVGQAKENGFMFYSGPTDIKADYQRVKTEGLWQENVLEPIFMLENGLGNAGAGGLMPATSLDMGNGQFLAFAPNQVIAKSDKAGFDTYIVYSVPGIETP